VKPDSAYHLSRIQAEGWNAARSIPASQLAELNDNQIDLLNPYSKGSARSRWNVGFKSALECSQR
jgi:hypothetical protein